MKFWIIDAFAKQAFSGNPAGVFMVHEFPNNQKMQNIAAEINLSETAFIKKLSQDYYHIRWFTPNSEAPLCGHATIAATHFLVESELQQNKTPITFKSLSGELIATKNDSLVTLNFPRYDINFHEFNDQLREIVNIKPINTSFSRDCFILEFQSCQQILKLNPSLQLLKKLDCRALIATAKADEDFPNYDFISRYFAPRVGIDEDPVCASAHCRLIPYWSDKLNKKSLIAYQASKRGGTIICQDIEDRVLISGTAVTVIKGELC